MERVRELLSGDLILDDESALNDKKQNSFKRSGSRQPSALPGHSKQQRMIRVTDDPSLFRDTQLKILTAQNWKA